MSKIPKIIPRGKQILVKQDAEKKRVSEYGIVTPTNVEQERKSVGTVLAVGPEIKDVKKGDRVIYATFAGDKISFGDSGKKEVDLVLLLDDEVLAFIED